MIEIVVNLQGLRIEIIKEIYAIKTGITIEEKLKMSQKEKLIVEGEIPEMIWIEIIYTYATSLYKHFVSS